jgi:hypothetical protein
VLLRIFVLFIIYVTIFGDNAFAGYDEFRHVIENMLLQKIPINAKETIRLKHIEFKGDVKNKLIEMCKDANALQRCDEGIYKDYRSARSYCIKNYEDGNWCQIKSYRDVDMGIFTYGNLSSGDARVDFNNKGELMYYHQTALPNKLTELIELLTTKYGNPLIVNDINDKDDRSHKRLKAYWMDSNGTVIAIDNKSIEKEVGDYTLQLGEINIMSHYFIDKMIKRFMVDESSGSKKRNYYLDNM